MIIELYKQLGSTIIYCVKNKVGVLSTIGSYDQCETFMNLEILTELEKGKTLK